jgi:putative sterol carrier protein
MPAFPSREAAAAVFGELYGILVANEVFTSRMRNNDLTLRLVHTKPDCTVFVSADEVIVGENGPDAATINIKMSCDTAHELWLGKLLMPVAISTGRVRISGTVPKLLELVPILGLAFDRYPEIAAVHGVEM